VGFLEGETSCNREKNKVTLLEKISIKEIPNLKGLEHNIPAEIRNQVLLGPGITKTYRAKIGLHQVKKIKQAIL
jgi:hypothetical protein